MPFKIKFIFIIIISFISLDVSGQTSNERRVKIPLADFLKELEKEFDLIFNYQSALLDTCHIFDTDSRNTIGEVLAYLRASTPLEFVDRQPHIIIKEKVTPPVEIKTLRGTITDAARGMPLPYATLLLVGTNRGTQADESGQFTLDLHSDEIAKYVEVALIGYQSERIEVQDLLESGKTQIALQQDEYVIEDVLVSEHAVLPVEFKSDQGYYDIRSDQLQLQAGWGEADVLRMLQVLPGIQSIDESSANLHIRGGTPDQNLMLIDDIPVYKPGHFFGFFSTINSNLVDQIKVYKGGFGATYGGRASGVIDIKNRLSQIDRFHGSVGLTPINFHLDLGTPLFEKKSSLLIGTRGSVLGSRHPPLFKSTLNQKFQFGKIADYRNFEAQDLFDKNEVQYTYDDFNFRWQYRYKKDDAITFSHFSNQDDFRYDFEIDQPSFTQITYDENQSSNRGSSIKATNRWLPWWQSMIHIVDSKFENNYSAIYSSKSNLPWQARAFQNNLLEHNRLALHQNFRINKSHRLDFGVEVNRWDIVFETAYERVWVPETDTLNLEMSNTVTTTFLDYKYQHNDELFLQFGVRRNRLGGIKEKKYEPRFSIKYKIPESPWLLKGSVGTYHQFISQIVLDRNEDNLGTANGIWLTTELNVVPIVQSQDLIIGLTYQDRGWTLDLEAYRKRTEGLSALNLQIDRNEQEVSPGESEATGMELILQKKFGRYRSLLSYTLASVNYQFPDFNQRSFFPAPHDRRHYLQWNHMYALGAFDFVIAWHLGSGLPYSIPSEILQIEVDSGGDVFHELYYDKRNTERLDAYHRLDCSLHYRWQGRRLGVKAGCSLFNLYGRANVVDRRYRVWYPNEDKLQPELTYADRIGLRFTPSIYATLIF